MAASLAPLDINALCIAFTATLNTDTKSRKEAEQVLAQLSLRPGLLALLAKIVTNPKIDDGVKTSVAIFLKNEIRLRWDSRDKEAEVYADHEKQAFRDLLIPLLECVVAEGVPHAITNSIDDCVRHVVRFDYPEKWSNVFAAVVEHLGQRNNINAIRAGLLVLRRLVKKYEYRSPQDKELISHMVKVTFPLLLALACDLCKENCFANEVTSSMVKTICKIYWSSTQMVLASGEAVEASIDSWMQFMDHAIETPVPETVIEANPELEVRSALQQYKAKKWALQIVHRFLVRYGSSSFAEIPTMKNDPGQLLGRYFIQNWAVKFMNRFVNILRAKKNNSVWISERMENLILQYLTQSLELSLTYKELKPNVEFILYEVCFPLLCYNQADVEKWELDPTELIRSQGIVLPGGLRGCAVEFIQTLARIRGRDFFESLSNFVQTVLVAHQNSSPEERRGAYNQRKDGALFMIGAISDRLNSKKRQLQMEPFLSQFVLPELTNKGDPFLRLRACWTYRQFLDQQRNGIKVFKDPQKLIEAFTRVTDLCEDRELLIRVEAAVALRTFLDVEQVEIRAAVAAQIPRLMEKLFNVMAQVPDNDLIVSTLESLVLNFEAQIPPYAVQFIRYLVPVLLRAIDVATRNGKPEQESPISNASSSYEREDFTMTAMSVASAVISVLSTLTEPQLHPIFEQVAPHLVELLDVMLSPAGLDFVDDGLAILTYLTFYCPKVSSPTDLWRYYERCYQTVCGGTSSHLVLEGVCAGGWAPDYLDKMLAPLDNLISRDPERFLTGVSSIEGKSYKQLLLEIVKKCVVTVTDPEIPKYALELMMLLFEGYVGKSPAVDDMMAPCFQVLIEYMQVLRKGDEGAAPRSNYSLAVRLLSTMVVYNPILLLQLCEGRALIDELLQIFSNIDSVKTYEGKRVFVLAFAQLLDLSASGKLPGPLQSHTADVVRAIANQLKKAIDLRKKNDEDGIEDDSDDDDDSEQDIDEDEDASNQIQANLSEVIRQAVANEENESDDDYFDQEAATDNLPVRESPMDKLDELEIVSSLLHRMPNVFAEVLGAVDTGILQQFIVAEAERRQALIAIDAMPN